MSGIKTHRKKEIVDRIANIINHCRTENRLETRSDVRRCGKKIYQNIEEYYKEALNQKLICGADNGHCEHCEIMKTCLHFKYGMMRRDVSELETIRKSLKNKITNEKEDDEKIKQFMQGINHIWYETGFTVEEKIKECIRFFVKIVFPENMEIYYKILDAYDEIKIEK